MTARRRALLGFAAYLVCAAQAHAGCSIDSVLSATPSSAMAGAYTVSSVPSPSTVAVTLVLGITTDGSGTCEGAISLQRPASSAQMTRTPAAPLALPYQILSGGSPVITYGASAPVLVLVPGFSRPSGTTTATVSLALTVAPQSLAGVPSAGSYADTLTLSAFDVSSTPVAAAGQKTLNVTAAVTPSCALSAPGSINFDFSSDVSTGIPAGTSKSAAFAVNCTSPSKIRLSGSALVQTPARPQTPGFDALINYHASATSQSSVSMTTTGTTPISATSSTPVVSSGGNVPVTVQANLIPGNPLLGGSAYSGVLQVIVDPEL
jgi:hypothetical protein